MSDNAIQHYVIDDFTFHDGTVPTSVQLAYLVINPNASKTALVLTCFRGRLQSTLTFADGALRDHKIIAVALFGNGESSSPSNMTNFPRSPDYRDCVRAQHQLLTLHLNVETIDVIVGFSMGGQCAYYWTLLHPEMVRNTVMICSSARTSRHNYQFLEGPKAALEYSADYRERGSHGSAPGGLRAFGKAYSAWLTSPEWFEQEEYKSLGYECLRDWDHEVAGTNYHSWHPDDLLSKIAMWQKGDVTSLCGPGDISLQDALSRIKARVLLMPCQTDQYFHWEASEKESRWIPRATLRVIPSVWGHLAGLGIRAADTEWMDQMISKFLKEQ